MHIVFLSKEQVEKIHANQIALYGGQDGIRDHNLLDSAVGAPKASFDGQLLYPTLFLMEATYFFSLIQNHAFVDGNERTAVMTVFIFLYMNGYLLQVDEDELVEYAVSVVTEKPTRQEIADYLEKNSTKRKTRKDV